MDFYKPIFIENRERIVASKFKLVRLRAISTKITKGETPLWKGDEYQEKGIRFVKSENVLTGSLFFSKSVFIDDSVHQRMKRSQLKNGDVLLNIVGASIGRCCVYNRLEPANINQAVCLIRPSTDVNPHWLCTVLNSKPFQTIFDQIKSGGARDNIDLYQVRALKVPFPLPEIQNHIAEIMQSAYARKKQKEQEADALLDSIDAYVLAELGIEMPAVEETRKVFVVNRSEIEGRLDPDNFLALRDADFQAIRSSVFPVKKLRRLSTLVTKGESPLWRGDSFQDRGIPFLRGKNIKGAIDFDDIVHIPKDVHERMKRSVLNDDFFLLTIAGTLGDVAFFKKEYPECNINQDIAKIKLTDEISYEYAVVYFQTRFAKSQIRILSNGATRGHLNFSQVRSFDVIVPPRDIQDKIVDEVKNRRSEAKKLSQEADAIVEAAKREAERVMLEGTSG